MLNCDKEMLQQILNKLVNQTPQHKQIPKSKAQTHRKDQKRKLSHKL